MVTSELSLTCCKLNASLHSCHDKFVANLHSCHDKFVASLLQTKIAIWGESKNHTVDCYVCTCSVKGYNLKNKMKIFYPNIPSTRHLVSHGPGIHGLFPSDVLENTASYKIRPYTKRRSRLQLLLGTVPGFFGIKVEGRGICRTDEQ
ncbi:hypothetical protein AVEN_27522-1 [Araneus ventricosus]|uniref:Uncharacterized protein n=1 Tax=Araneus ventricosus TaxID=182803 RepID=A0A4Y2K4P9_ARAVE|nr:hypothetical protein AVEN_27522-1 [Araneus ventricosus]